MSLVTPSFNGITAGLSTSQAYPDVLECISYQRLPTDPVYTSKLKLVSLQTGFGYVVYDKDNLFVTSGDYTANPIYYSSVLAYSNADAITVYFLKYGNSYKKSTFAITNIETLMFMAQEANVNTTLSAVAVAALTGIAVDKAAKTITVSTPHSQADVYDYLQYYQSQVANVDLLPSGEIFSTVLGTNYTLKSAWSLIFTAAPTGIWNIQGNVTFNAQFDIANFNVSGTVFFDAPSILTALDSQIGSLDTVTGDETVSYTPTGTSNTPTNLDAVNITIEVAPTYTGLDFTGLVTGSQVVIYQNGTTTEIQRNNSTTTQETWNELYSVDQLVDYTILKAGYDPIRVNNINASNTIQSVAVQQKVARAYQSGLTFVYGTDGAYDAVTKIFTVAKALTVQQYYSCMIDAFIAQSSLRNVAFCITPNGSNSFSLDECTIEPTDITWLYRDGMRETVSGVVTRKWAAVWSSGSVGTDIAEIQQAAGATPIKGWNAPTQLSSGNVDMLLKVYDSALSLDYQSYLVVEYAKAGKYQGRIVAHDVYPTIEDDLYVVAVEPTSSPITAADPVLANPPTITLELTPVTWNGKAFSITIKDSVAGNTGTAIAQWINWNIREENDSLFQTLDPMNWYDMVLDSASSWETAQGIVLGQFSEALVGVRVVLNDGTTEHPDFIRHQADDGTYWVKPITAQGSITGIFAGSRLRIVNETKATETYNDIVAGTSYSESYSDGTTYASGDILSLYLAYQSGTTAKQLQKITTVATSSGWSALASQGDDGVYNVNAIDGTLVTGYSADYVADADGLNIDITITGSTFNIKEGYAWYSANLMTANGLALFANVMSAKDVGNYEFNTSIADIHLDNIGTQNLLETSLATLTRSDGTDPRLNPPTGGFGISMNVGNVLVANVGGSALTASESAALSAIDGRTTGLSFTKPNELDVNVVTNSTAGSGSGATPDEVLIAALKANLLS